MESTNNVVSAKSNPTLNNGASNGTESQLSSDEMKLVLAHRQAAAQKKEADEVLRGLRAVREVYGQEVRLVRAHSTSVEDINLRIELEAEETLAALRHEHAEARAALAARERELAAVRASVAANEGKVAMVVAAVGTVSLLYGAIVGGAAGREAMRAEALSAAGPFAKLLARRLAKGAVLWAKVWECVSCAETLRPRRRPGLQHPMFRGPRRPWGCCLVRVRRTGWRPVFWREQR